LDLAVIDPPRLDSVNSSPKGFMCDTDAFQRSEYPDVNAETLQVLDAGYTYASERFFSLDYLDAVEFWDEDLADLNGPVLINEDCKAVQAI